MIRRPPRSPLDRSSAASDVYKRQEKLKGHPLFAHVTLTRSERSPIAALVTEMLEEISPDALP